MNTRKEAYISEVFVNHVCPIATLTVCSCYSQSIQPQVIYGEASSPNVVYQYVPQARSCAREDRITVLDGKLS